MKEKLYRSAQKLVRTKLLFQFYLKYGLDFHLVYYVIKEYIGTPGREGKQQQNNKR